MANEEERTAKLAVDVVEGFLGRGIAARRRAAESLCELSNPRMGCFVCGYEQMLTVESAEEYLTNGWPRHCDHEMEIRTGEGKC